MVENVNSTVDFYRDVLGFELVMTMPEQGPLAWALMQRGDVQIMFQSRESLAGEFPGLESAPPAGTLTFHVGVADVEALYERLKDRVRILKPPHRSGSGTEFSLLDPNGFVVTFAESEKRTHPLQPE